jgi:hypothetical protein
MTVNLTIEPIEYKITIGRVGPQGARGVPGADGLSGGANLTGTAGANISGHVVVRYDNNGLIQVADATILSHANKIVGITTGAVTTGNEATIQNGDLMVHVGWSWTPDEPVFLGASGALTQSTSGLLFTQVVGIANSATSITINIQPAIVLAA